MTMVIVMMKHDKLGGDIEMIMIISDDDGWWRWWWWR